MTYRFECTLCGACCSGRQDVWLNPLDLQRLAAHLGFCDPAGRPDPARLWAEGWVEWVNDPAPVWRPRLRFQTRPWRQCRFLVNEWVEDEAEGPPSRDAGTPGGGEGSPVGPGDTLLGAAGSPPGAEGTSAGGADTPSPRPWGRTRGLCGLHGQAAKPLVCRSAPLARHWDAATGAHTWTVEEPSPGCPGLGRGSERPLDEAVKAALQADPAAWAAEGAWLALCAAESVQPDRGAAWWQARALEAPVD